MKWVSIFRLKTALEGLTRWRAANDSQGCMHLMHFLSSKRKGIGTDRFRPHAEQDDFDFCDKYLRVMAGEHPYYDPLDQSFRIASHAHSNIATARKKTFADKWDAAEYKVVNGEEQWRFKEGYLDTLMGKMKKSGSFQKLPVFDLAAWLLKFESFDDGATLDDVLRQFETDFKISPRERETLFQLGPLGGPPDTVGLFFSSQPLEKGLVLQLVRNPSDFDLSEAINTTAIEGGKTHMSIERVIAMIRDHNRRQIVFQGPPGTGKTFAARQVAASLLGVSYDKVDSLHLSLADGVAFDAAKAQYDKSQKKGWALVQFHPGYGYEDFVRGISPVLSGDGTPKFQVTDKAFALACRFAATAPSTQLFILVIDEINRADLAKVFGELIYGLEYRGRPVNVQYAKGPDAAIVVPENLVILGTMNTADRSIAHLDYAIRRRFDFVEVPPDRAVIERFHDGALTKVAALRLFDSALRLLVERPDQMVGHAYFLHKDPKALANAFVFQVLPLLNDYRKEGIVDEQATLTIPGWPGGGLPIRHDRPFELCGHLVEWAQAQGDTAK